MNCSDDGLGGVVRRSVNVAMPPEAVTVVVPCSGPEPIGKEAAVTWVLLSPVSRLPYWSST